MDVEPPHLNPLIQEDVWLARISVNNIFEGLVRRHPQSHQLEPSLASAWTSNEDGTYFTFTLRRDVTFHDGNPLTARDVLFTLDRLMDPAVATAPMRSNFSDLKTWEAPSEHLITLRFSKPNFKILESLSHLTILPKHIYGSGDLNRHPANHRPVGTGPFRFERWDRGSAVRLQRYGGYWGAKPAMERVIYRLVRSRDKVLGMAGLGQLDLVPRVLPQQACGSRAPIGQPRITRRFRTVIHYPVQFYSILLNHRSALFSDVRVRRALAMLVNRALVADQIFCGRARLVSGPYWLEKPGYDATVTPWPYDPKAAAALLWQAGWRDRDGDGVLSKDGVRFSFRYLRFSESEVQRRLLPILAEGFRKAGLEMQVETLSWTAALGRLKAHQFHMTDLNWHYYYEQDLFQIYHSSQCEGGSNYGCYANPQADALMEEIRRTMDPASRHGLERRLHRLFHEDLPGVFLFNVGDVSLVSRRFTGLEPSPEWFQVRDARPAEGG